MDPQRLGIFGGTFDPVHIGHLIVAEQCREAARLDRVLFMPAARPPHKLDEEITPFAQRVEMLSLAIAGQPAFAIDQREKDRAGPSFTVDTLTQIHEQHPNTELFLIIGADTLHDFPGWYRPERILQLATLLVVDRPNDEGVARPVRNASDSGPLPPATRVDMPLIGVASTDIRNRMRSGRSIRFLTPRPVEIYIQEKGLYRSPSQNKLP